MVKNHLKRIAMPKTWNILRKNNTFITKPNPGAHNYYLGTSINTLLKEIIGLVETKKEVKKILHDKNLQVDGKICHDEKFNVGFMDVITIQKESYRVVLDSKGKLATVKIKGAEATQKLSRITGKNTLKGGKIQLTTSDGRVINIEKDTYKTGDCILISLPSQKIEAHYPLIEGASTFIIKGKHAGSHGIITKLDEEKVLIKTTEGNYLTKKEYAFITGDKKTAVTCSL